MKDRVVSDQCCEVNLGTSVLVPRTRMPKPKFGHIAQMVGELLIVAGGISNAMHQQGLLSVPRGDPDCFAFCIRSKRWYKLADLPIGRIHSTSFVIENRYIFILGGFD